ncbi:hypothetical protein R4Z10_08210 [Niallia sp. XMNu-256]|uniref:hypothetical protein n=1 Tax=Niallia sp. XMNu-256 TaxID=3082444 RepID=UPI0030CD93B7
MQGKKVVYNHEIYTVIYEYGNGQIEIKKENSIPINPDVELVKKEEVHFLEELAN